jgi:hypothetical protein
LFVPIAWLSLANQKAGLAAFFGFSNYVLARSNNDYFSPRVEFNPFTRTWPLAVEEQFYLLFPCLFIAWLWGRRQVSAALFAVALIANARSDERFARSLCSSRQTSICAVPIARSHSAASRSGRRCALDTRQLFRWRNGSVVSRRGASQWVRVDQRASQTAATCIRSARRRN